MKALRRRFKSRARDLATVRFFRVMESGLSGTTDHFHTISFHTLPNPRRADELWPDLSPEKVVKQKAHRERVGRENLAYSLLTLTSVAGLSFAGKSVAVPFVGGAAATLVVAEILGHRATVHNSSDSSPGLRLRLLRP
jgi:hypothetical protein